MNDLTDTTVAPSDLDIRVIPGAPWHVPVRLQLPAQRDSEGRVWPAGGVRRVQDLSVAELLAAGVQIEWRLDDEVIPEDIGRQLVAARQADVDHGVVPVFNTDEKAL